VSPWTISEAVELCRQVEQFAPRFGCHVALTGGVLYKDGARKYLDLLFYRIRQVNRIDRAGLFKRLESVGLIKQTGWGWCYKATFNGKRVDLFFPDNHWAGPSEPWRSRVARRVRRMLGMSA
jgi:hypothetical protein